MIARRHVESKDLKKKTCSCGCCGRLISWTAENCYSFGVFLCPDCKTERIKEDERNIRMQN